MSITQKSKDIVSCVLELPKTLLTTSCGLALTAALGMLAPAAQAGPWEDFTRSPQKAAQKPETEEEPSPSQPRSFGELVTQGNRYISPYQFFVGNRFTSHGSTAFEIGARDFDPRGDDLTWDLRARRDENVVDARAAKTIEDARHELTGSIFARKLRLSKELSYSPRATLALGDSRTMAEAGVDVERAGVYHPHFGGWVRSERNYTDAQVRANGIRTRLSTDQQLSGFGFNAGFDTPGRSLAGAFDLGYFSNDVDVDHSLRGTFANGTGFSRSQDIAFDTSAWYGRATANAGPGSLTLLHTATATDGKGMNDRSDGSRRTDLVIAVPEAHSFGDARHRYGVGGIIRASSDTDSNRGLEGRMIVSHPIVARLRHAALVSPDPHSTQAVDVQERLAALQRRGLSAFELVYGDDRNHDTDLHSSHLGLGWHYRRGVADGPNRFGIEYTRARAGFAGGANQSSNSFSATLGFAHGLELRCNVSHSRISGERDTSSLGFDISIPYGESKRGRRH